MIKKKIAVPKWKYILNLIKDKIRIYVAKRKSKRK